MEPTAVINAIALTVIVWSLIEIRRNKREIRRVEEMRRTRVAATSPVITTVDAAALPTHLGYDGRVAQPHGIGVNVYLGRAVGLGNWEPRGIDDLTPVEMGEVYDLEHHFGEGLFVTGGDRWSVARTVVRQWGAAGLDALAVGSSGECLIELWGTSGLRFAPGSAAAAASQEVLEELERRFTLCQHHGVNNFLNLPEGVRPERLLLVVAVESFNEDDFIRVSKAVGGVAILGRAMGVHLLVVANSDHRDTQTDWLRSLRNNCVAVTTRFTRRQAGYCASELGGGWDASVPGRAAYGLASSCVPFQAAVSPRQALPMGWSVEDVTLALAAGWSVEQVKSAGGPTDEHRAAWQMLAALRG